MHRQAAATPVACDDARFLGATLLPGAHPLSDLVHPECGMLRNVSSYMEIVGDMLQRCTCGIFSTWRAAHSRPALFSTGDSSQRMRASHLCKAWGVCAMYSNV
jgi:hypothetical protein